MVSQHLPRYVLGVDPGLTTGLCLWSSTQDNVVLYQGKDGVNYEIEDGIRVFRPHVVCEAFVITANTYRNSAAPWSLMRMGAASYLAERAGVPFIIQPQSSAKKFATDTRLRALGWYRKGMPHANDASRQVLLYLVDKCGWWDERLSKKES